MNKIYVLIFFLSSSSLSLATVKNSGGILLNEKSYKIEVDSSLFLTTGYFDSEGKKIPKKEGTTFSLVDADFKISYGFTKNIEASFLGKGRRVSSDNGVDIATNTGTESMGVELKYSLGQIDSLSYAIGLRYRQTLYSNTRYGSGDTPPNDEVILGDDGREYGVDFFLTSLKFPWRMDFLVGYNSPANDLSSEIIYDGKLAYNFSKFGFFIGVEGIYSLKKDQFADAPGLKPVLSKGESYSFNSINREKVAPYLGIDFTTEKFLLGLRAGTVLSGHSTDKGNSGMLTIAWNSIGKSSSAVKIDSFKEYQIEGSVLKVSARGNLIKIDQGISTDVEKGTRFDIYQTDYFGGNVLVASGVVYQIGSDWSVIKLVKKYKEIEIKPGFAARGY